MQGQTRSHPPSRWPMRRHPRRDVMGWLEGCLGKSRWVARASRVIAPSWCRQAWSGRFARQWWIAAIFCGREKQNEVGQRSPMGGIWLGKTPGRQGPGAARAGTRASSDPAGTSRNPGRWLHSAKDSLGVDRKHRFETHCGPPPRVRFPVLPSRPPSNLQCCRRDAAPSTPLPSSCFTKKHNQHSQRAQHCQRRRPCQLEV